jgi:excisionase family DNA binding protein
MADTSGTYQRASVLDAARMLGVSPTTIRRMVRAGTLRAERVLRPQGHTFVVLVPTDSQPAASTSHQVSAEARAEVPPSEQLAALASAFLTPVLAPLVGELAASRQTIERQASRHATQLEEQQQQFIKQAELIGAQRAELALLRAEVKTLTASISTLEASTAPETVEPTGGPPTPLSRLLALWRWLVLVLVVAVTTMVTLLAWPR